LSGGLDLYADFLRYSEPIAILVLLALAFVPIFVYLATGARLRRLEIIGAISDDGARLYFQKFFPSVPLPDVDIVRLFERHYARHYGTRHYVIPVVLLATIAVFLLILTTRTVFAWLDGTTSAHRLLPSVAVAAVAGAYMWVVSDMIRRNRTRELSPSDVYWGCLRLAISVPLGFAFVSLLKEEAAVFVAFMLGAFPTPYLITILRRIGTRRLGLSEAGEDPRSNIELLQGISPGVAERFRDEGILTITQLAYCDPVDLTIRCHYAFSFVVDCVSQALAWPYFAKDFPIVQQFALRGAYEISTMVGELDAGTAQEQAGARRTIDALATNLQRDPVVLERTLREIAEDPYTKFILDFWEQHA